MTLVVEDLAVAVAGRRLVEDVSFELPPGRVTAVVGPNGAGKSTLLRAIAGDLEHDHGRIAWDGRELGSLSDVEQAGLRAVVTQAPLLAFDFTAADVVAMGWLGGDGVERAAAIEAVMAESDTLHLRERVFSTLSGGEQQRVQYARGLLQIWRRDGDVTPRWLLLDEPTASLDVANAIALLRSVRRWAAARTGVLVVLHDLNLAVRFADRLLLLATGRQVAYGAPDQATDPRTLSRVYGTPVHVEHHAALDRLVVLT